MEYIIRKMTSCDWQEVKRIYNISIENGEATFTTECPEYEVWDGRHLQDCRFVIETGGKIAGWCAIMPMSSMYAYRGSVEVSIYIDMAYRHMGFGEILLNYLCDESERCGYWSLYSVIFSKNTASIRLHEKCGFRLIGTREKVARDRFGEWLDTTLMEKRSKKII